MRTLILAEHDNGTLNDQTLNAVTCASLLGSVDILVAGSDCKAVATDAAGAMGVQTVVWVDEARLAHGLAEDLAALLVSLSQDYDVFLAVSSSFGKTVMPRVAALLDVQQISDICEVVDANTFKRPIYAGNAIQTVRSKEAKKVITLRASAFAATPPTGGTATVKALMMVDTPTLCSFVSSHLTASGRPDLRSAPVIVSGGRGLGSLENFALLERLADVLGGGVGASRAAVDAGFAPNDYQIGQSGKVVAPDLYIAVGISGAIQHLAGMKDSRIIVAINTDPDAPIFKVADYGLVADLFEVLPKLAEALEQ